MIHSCFREPKICNLNMPIMINKQILRLQVPINNILLMQVHKPIQDLNKIKPGMLLLHPLNSLKIIKQLPPGTIVKHKADKVMRLKAVIHPNNKRMIKPLIDHFLILDNILLLVLGYKPLHHDLHGVELPVPETSDQVYFAESTDGQALADLVLIEPALSDVLEAVEGGFLGKDSLAQSDLIVQDDVLVH